MTGNEPRFSGIARLYGSVAAQRICNMRVCVVGMGGVGSWAVEALARSGVGKLTLIDYDEICASNINRQVQALESCVGEKKTRALENRIRDINPKCSVTVVDDFATDRNLFDLLPPDKPYDYVIDAIDSIRFKAALIYHCKRNKMPVITTGAGGGLSDPTQIQIRDLSRTFNDPLAAKVRARLRANHGFSRNLKRYFGVECVFSSQQQVYPKADGSVGQQKPGVHGVHLDCSMGYGSASFVTGTMGFVAVSRVIEKYLRLCEREKC
ncbi:HesA/MoeB/ThiF family protein =_ sulfur transfer pathway protein CsdL [hydrothermal vent metagenome]|uniref:HesA/MoeB/ThiF family protein => sulfur transfer pathway protein CsdL n=1 Tax=hydrothermal vent metagenome TaxID=652676 RepID=A0A3B0YGU2_9ZZZZ